MTAAAKRILIVVEATDGGVGRHAVDLSAGLGARGHDVHTIYSPKRADPDLVREINHSAGVNPVAVEINRRPGLTDLAAIARIRRYIKDFGPFDIVHGQSTKGAIGCIAAMGSSSARILTPHAFRSMDPRLRGAKRMAIVAMERFLAKFAHRVITVSPVELAHAEKMGIGAGKLATVINGAPDYQGPARGAARTKLGLRDGDIAIGFVGRLASQKAPDRLIDAFSDMAASAPDTRLVICGEGPLEPSLRTLVRDHGLADRVIWAGQTNGREVMAALDVFALASAYEAMPYVLIEAAAAGLPIVVTDVGGARTVVEPGVSGFIVANWDRAAFAGRLGELARQPEIRNRMAQAARAQSQKFGIARMIEETLEVYGATLESLRAPTAGLLNAKDGNHQAPAPNQR